MRLVKWLTNNRLRVTIINEEAIRKAVNQENKILAQQAAEISRRKNLDKGYRQLHNDLQVARRDEYVTKSIGYLNKKPTVKKGSVKNVNSYRPNPEYGEEYGHIVIYNQYWVEVDRFYCKKPIKNNPITHTFNVKAGTTVAHTNFVPDGQPAIQVDRDISPQYFAFDGTYKITMCFD
jgi:hypothetical protein